MDYRHDFPMLRRIVHGKPLIYLDTAATALKPQAVIDAMSDFYTSHYGTVNRAIYTLAQEATERFHAAREKTARFIGVSPEEIIFTRGTTDSINMFAAMFVKRFMEPGDEIILTVAEHHANLIPWQIQAEENGIVLKFIDVDDEGNLRLEMLDDLITKRTKLISCAHISNILGTIHPVRQIADIAHARGIYLMCDGAQAAPALKLDMHALGVDFYAFSGHKMYGPTGVGVLYGRYELLEELSPTRGGGDMIDEVTLERSTYQKPPHRFEPGTPMIAEVIGLSAAIDYLEGIGMERIAAWEQKLLKQATAQLSAFPTIRILGTAEEKGGIISFNFDGIHPLDLGTLLDSKGIALRTGHHCTRPALNRFGLTATLRASFGLYNSPSDIDTLCQALEESLKVLC
ncbi:MAG: SufS family cysteine desulfurase [Chlamydiia bacterium]|nr:SufS family cysteine desulfurase [Chlamydiia bacterium]